MARIVVTGGRGALGTVLIEELRTHGQVPQVLTSRTASDYGNEVSGNLVTGENLRKAFKGTEVVIHCASNFLDHERVDVLGTRNLISNLDRFSIQQIIYISILGVDHSSLPYYQSKKAAEDSIMQSGIPYCILRFSQFHDFVLSFIARFVFNSSQTIEIPSGLSFQSIDLRDVAAEIAQKLYIPSNLHQELAGPEVLTLENMVQKLFGHRYTGYSMLTADMRSDLHTAFSHGANLSTHKIASGITWSQFLGSLAVAG